MREWLSCLTEMCGSDGAVMENSFFLLTFGPFHNLFLGVPGLYETCLTQYLS